MTDLKHSLGINERNVMSIEDRDERQQKRQTDRQTGYYKRKHMKFLNFLFLTKNNFFFTIEEKGRESRTKAESNGKWRKKGTHNNLIRKIGREAQTDKIIFFEHVELEDGKKEEEKIRNT